MPDNSDEGFSVEEIAKQLGVAPSTARNELYGLRRQCLVVATRYTAKDKVSSPSK